MKWAICTRRSKCSIQRVCRELADFKTPKNRDKKGRPKLKIHPLAFPQSRGLEGSKNLGKGIDKIEGRGTDKCSCCKHGIIFNTGRRRARYGLQLMHKGEKGRISKQCHENSCKCNTPSYPRVIY